jgi:DNA polymerase IV
LERRIAHIDMDAFFASVEEVRDPSLRGRPLIIGGGPGDMRGVVSTASYEARRYGVRSAMPLSEARRLCPHGIFMRGDFARYRAASNEVKRVFEAVSPLVQMASIDEAYIDVTGSQRLFGGDDGIAHYVKSRIRERTGLPCTIAIASNKLVAKVASNESKPDGYLRIPLGGERAFFAALPVNRLPGIGPKMCERLEAAGITKLGQLANLRKDLLESLAGDFGITLQRSARGISFSEVRVDSIPKSIGRETTFAQDTRDWDWIYGTLRHLAAKAMFSLRGERMETARVSLKVRYANFDTRSFSKSLTSHTALDPVVLAAAGELTSSARARRDPVRLIGVSLSHLRLNQHQLQLFEGEPEEKWERVLRCADSVRKKHGMHAIRSACHASVNSNRSGPTREKFPNTEF